MPGLRLYAFIVQSAYNKGTTGRLCMSACMFTKLEIGYLGFTPKAVRLIHRRYTWIPTLRETQTENYFRKNGS